MPKKGVDYEWCEAYAKSEFDNLEKCYDSLESKAASTLSYLGGGTGFLTVGSIVGISAGQLSPTVALVATIPVMAALFSISRAIKSQQTAQIRRPSAVTSIWYLENEERGCPKGGIVGQWVLAMAQLREVVDKKGRMVDLSRKWCFNAICLLLLPLLTGILNKFLEPPVAKSENQSVNSQISDPNKTKSN